MREGGSSFVGRKPVLRALDLALAEGTPRAFLISGEAGIGKSRTAHELAQLAASHGYRVHLGSCSEVAGAPPLWPWVEPLSELLDGLVVERLAERLGPGSPLWRLLDEKRSRLASDDPGARFRLLRDVGVLVEAASEHRPRLFVMDDLHRADVPTAELLAYLAREGAPTGTVIVGTMRDGELAADGPLAEAVGRFARHARALPLVELSAAETGALADLTAGRTLPRELKHEIQRRSQGNPLFVRQLVEFVALRADDAEGLEQLRRETPEGVRHVIRERLRAASEPLLGVLRLAAVLGREFDADLVAALGGLEEARVTALLEASEARGLVQRSPQPGRYALGHALFRDVLYESMDPEAREHAHRRAVQAIRSLRNADEDPWRTRLTHHAIEGRALLEPGVLARAIGAVQGALGHHGHDEAAELAKRLLEALDSAPREAHRSSERAQLLRLLGEARWRGGRLDAARDAFAAAMDLARDVGDATVFGEAALSFAGRTDAVLGPEQTSSALLQEALDHLGPEPSQLRSALLARLASALYFAPEPTAGERASRDALACAEALDDAAAVAYALSSLQYSLYRPGTLDERCAQAARALELASRAGEERLLALCHYHGFLNALEAGDFAELDRHVAAYEAIAERTGQPYDRWQLLAMQTARAFAAGAEEEAERLATEALAAGRAAGSPNAVTFYAGHIYGLRREQGRLAELLPMMEEFAQQLPDMPAFAFARAEARLAAGEVDDTRTFLRAFVGSGLGELRVDMNWPSVVSIAARLCVLLGEAELAPPLTRLLEPLRGTCLVHPFGSLWDGPVEAYLGALAFVAGDRAQAERDLAQAEAFQVRIGARAGLERIRAARRELARRHCTPGAAADAPEPAQGVFARQRDGRWRVAFRGAEVMLEPTRGMHFLAILLARPGEEVHVFELLERAAPGRTEGARGAGGTELLDARARAEIADRLADLRELQEDAEARDDAPAAARAREELEQLQEHLASSLGLGGRSRRAGDPTERARKAVYNRIRDALAKLDTELPALARHLRVSLRTGRTCRYAPEGHVGWEVSGG